MTLTRLLAATLLVYSALAIAQTKTDSLAGSAQAAAANKVATVASSEPWKIIPSQPMHALSGSNALALCGSTSTRYPDPRAIPALSFWARRLMLVWFSPPWMDNWTRISTA
jgi:hypothetical protein